MIDQTSLESGYYWVRLTDTEASDGWEILWHDKDDDSWTECGSEMCVIPSDIIYINPIRLEQGEP